MINNDSKELARSDKMLVSIAVALVSIIIGLILYSSDSNASWERIISDFGLELITTGSLLPVITVLVTAWIIAEKNAIEKQRKQQIENDRIKANQVEQDYKDIIKIRNNLKMLAHAALTPINNMLDYYYIDEDKFYELVECHNADDIFSDYLNEIVKKTAELKDYVENEIPIKSEMIDEADVTNI